MYIIILILHLARFNRRYVALKLAYIGWNYSGFAIQEPPKVTIEVQWITIASTFNVIPAWITSLHCSR